MKTFITVIFAIFFDILSLAGISSQLKSSGWTITVDSGNESLTIEYEKLGVVAREVQIHIKQGDKFQKLTSWKVTSEDKRMNIRTENPSTHWSFYVHNNVLEVRTAYNGVITAIAPSKSDRFPARMIDISGKSKPVAWMGTNEVIFTYGSQKTKNLSFLPAENPDVMYLSLGQVSSRNMHCLFDRKSNMMLEFNKLTQLQRDSENPDRMNLSIQLGASTAKNEMKDLQILTVHRDYYTEVLGLPVYKPIDDTYFKVPPVIWNSWTNYYYKITEEDVIKNTNWVADNLAEYGLNYIVIDDGPERGRKGEHYWISHWNKETFPHGPEWLVDYINSKGLKAGLWLVPNAYAGALDTHPEWYIHDKDGKHIMDYNTPALDETNPEVLDFLTHLFTTLKDWGFEYYKFDGEFSLPEYIPGVDKARLYDTTILSIEAYHNRLRVIRDAVGNNTFLEGCPAGAPLQGIGYFNSYFNGEDIYNSWHGMYSFFLSLNDNLFLNNVATYLMPGEGICVSPKMDIKKAKTVYNPEFIRVASSREADISSVGTTMNEARTIVTFAALSGTPYSFADRLPDLPSERIDLLKKSLPALPITPMDLFSRGGYANWDLFNEFTPATYEHDFPRIIDLKIEAASGQYDVVAATNWGDNDQSRTISFDNKLGLDPEKSYLVFDFWNQEFLGEFKDEMKINIQAHDTRVFQVKARHNHPQILATNRHISGAYSIESIKWDSRKQTLSGSSKTISGKPYSLFVYIPNDFSFSKVKSNATITSEKVDNNMLILTFIGRKEGIDWAINFKGIKMK